MNRRRGPSRGFCVGAPRSGAARDLHLRRSAGVAVDPDAVGVAVAVVPGRRRGLVGRRRQLAGAEQRPAQPFARAQVRAVQLRVRQRRHALQLRSGVQVAATVR